MSATTTSTTLVVDPELTIYQVAALRPIWLDAYAAGAHRVDLSRVQEMDSAGLQLIVALARLAERDGQPLEFLDASAPVRECCALLGVQGLLAPATGETHA